MKSTSLLASSISTLFAAVMALPATSQAATLLFDFGSGATPAATPVNNFTDAQATIPDALDSTGAATGISLSVDPVNNRFSGSNTNGTITPTGAASIFTSTSTQDSLFGHTQIFGTTPPRPLVVLTLGGLDTSGTTLYTFDFFASRTGVGDNRETEYAVAGLNSSTIFLDPSNNTSNITTSAGILPTPAGEITLTMRPGPNNTNGTGFFYLGAMQLTTSPVPEPSSSVLLLLGTAAVLRRRRTA